MKNLFPKIYCDKKAVRINADGFCSFLIYRPFPAEPNNRIFVFTASLIVRTFKLLVSR